MSFCLGVKVKEGLVGIADTRVISGTECIIAHKVSSYHIKQGAFFLMTSGLRSVSDKALTYFNDLIDDPKEPYDRLFKAVNAFARMIRRAAKEDKSALEESGVAFDINALIGGQLSNDKEHKLYLVYPEGNWVEIADGTPYHIIGEGGYGKPVLDRTLDCRDSLQFALKVGCLAFDSTRISAADVDFPIDVVLYNRDSHRIIEHRYEGVDLEASNVWWQDHLRKSVHDLPAEWTDDIIRKLPEEPLKMSVNA